MTGPAPAELSAIWARHHAEWRDTAQVTSQWREAAQTEPRLLSHRVTGEWWELLAATGLTLLVTREYEHLVMALSCAGSEPNVTFFPMPHPSGMAVDPQRGVLHVASTRNPNQVYDLVPTCQLLARLDVPAETVAGNPLVPLRSRFLPGCLYLHDLAFIGGVLHANAVGQNAVIRLDSDGGYKPVWMHKKAG